MIWLASGHFRHLHQALVADHRLEIAHHHRIRMWAGDGAGDVERISDVSDPIAHCFIERILQRLGAGLDGHYLCPKRFIR